MKFLLFLTLLPLAVLAQSTLPTKPFLVVSTGIIRRNLPFNVAIRKFGDVTNTVTLTLTLRGTSDQGDSYNIPKTVQIASGRQYILVPFDASKLPKGSYELSVVGEGFEESKPLVYASKDSALLIQLEKAVYALSQTVRFRIFAVNSLTYATTPSNQCSAYIKDSKGNLIEKYLSLEFVNGKYSNELILGSKSIPGLWEISVQCGNQTTAEIFEVAEYNLSAFDVALKIPSNNPYSDSRVPVSISASYSTGDKVNGLGTLKVSRNGQLLITKNIIINNGIAVLALDTISELGARRGYWETYSCNLTVTDAIFKATVSTINSFQVIPYKYTISLSSNQSLKPGRTFSYSVFVYAGDNSVPPQGTNVTVNIYPINIIQTLSLIDGSAVSTVVVPTFATYLSIEASCAECQNNILYANEPSASAGAIDLYPTYTDESKSAYLNKLFEIKAVVDDQLDFTQIGSVNFFVASKGVLLQSSVLTLTSKTAIFSIKPDIRYFPKFTVVAAFLLNNEIVSKQVTINVKGPLNNFVRLSFNQTEVRPDTSLSFNVDSQCNSVVSLSAIDQRLLQLRSGNEILYDDVVEAIGDENWTEAIDIQNIGSFYNARLVTFTNWDLPFEFPSMDFFGPPPTLGENTDSNSQIRRNFAENFCWTDVIPTTSTKAPTGYSSACTASVSCNIPSSMAKYLVYSVSMNSKYGIGVTDVPSEVTAKLPFYMVWKPPYSIKRDEILVIDIAFFNSIDQNQDIVINIDNDDQRIQGVNLATYGWNATSHGFEKTVRAQASTDFTVQFAAKFLYKKFTGLGISARGPLAGDAIERAVEVGFVGVPRTITKSVLINGNEPMDSDLVCDYPEGTDEDSKSVSAIVTGDILGKALNNIQKLIYFPSGCGEQNLFKLIPDVVIFRYLLLTDKLTPELSSLLRQYISSGVRNHLGYRRSDGSFTFLGGNGSVWLTIYSAFALNKAKQIATVQENIITEAVEFVLRNQQTDGSFIETGPTHITALQGGVQSRIGLTAYVSFVLTSLLTSFPNKLEYATARDKANNYIVQGLTGTNAVSMYDLGIATYALLISDDPQGTSAYNRFMAMSYETQTEIYWKTTETFRGRDGISWSYQIFSLNIETTSYGLLNAIAANDDTTAFKIVTYLTRIANDNGGYASTQDTVLALTALGEYVSKYQAFSTEMSLTLTPNVGSDFSAFVDDSTALTLQQFELDDSVTSLNVVPSFGNTGRAVVSLVCKFNQDPKFVVQSFEITHNYTAQCSDQNRIRLRICTRYIPAGTSNMAILTMTLPSGYEYKNWWGAPSNSAVTLTEVYDAGSKIVYYFNSIGNQNICVYVDGYRTQTVNQLKGGTIIVNDYYDTSLEGIASYPAPTYPSC